MYDSGNYITQKNVKQLANKPYAVQQSVWACERAGLRKIEFKRGVINVLAWSVKLAGVVSPTYKAPLLYK